jgi:hypothetical protein
MDADDVVVIKVTRWRGRGDEYAVYYRKPAWHADRVSRSHFLAIDELDAVMQFRAWMQGRGKEPYRGRGFVEGEL